MLKPDEKQVHSGEASVPLYRVEVEKGPHWQSARRVEDGAESVSFSVLLDVRAVLSMVRQAARNKGGSSRDGALRVVITRRVKL